MNKTSTSLPRSALRHLAILNNTREQTDKQLENILLSEPLDSQGVRTLKHQRVTNLLAQLQIEYPALARIVTPFLSNNAPKEFTRSEVQALMHIMGEPSSAEVAIMTLLREKNLINQEIYNEIITPWSQKVRLEETTLAKTGWGALHVANAITPTLASTFLGAALALPSMAILMPLLAIVAGMTISVKAAKEIETQRSIANETPGMGVRETDAFDREFKQLIDRIINGDALIDLSNPQKGKAFEEALTNLLLSGATQKQQTSLDQNAIDIISDFILPIENLPTNSSSRDLFKIAYEARNIALTPERMWNSRLYEILPTLGTCSYDAEDIDRSSQHIANFAEKICSTLFADVLAKGVSATALIKQANFYTDGKGATTVSIPMAALGWWRNIDFVGNLELSFDNLGAMQTIGMSVSENIAQKRAVLAVQQSEKIQNAASQKPTARSSSKLDEGYLIDVQGSLQNYQVAVNNNGFVHLATIPFNSAS
jgi:hypothetical protein